MALERAFKRHTYIVAKLKRAKQLTIFCPATHTLALTTALLPSPPRMSCGFATALVVPRTRSIPFYQPSNSIRLRAGSSSTSLTRPEDLARGLSNKRREAYNLLVAPPGRSKRKKKKGYYNNVLTATDTKHMFMLSEDNLCDIQVMERNNPKNAKFAPMRLFNRADVIQRALQVHNGPQVFLRAALAAQRKRPGKRSSLKKGGVVLLTTPNAVQYGTSSGTVEVAAVPEYVLVDGGDHPTMRRRFHFLLQFTTYPLLRDEKMAMKLWMERFTDREAVLKFPHLPDFMRAEVQAVPTSTDSSLLPTLSSLWDTTNLQDLDVKERQRAQQFFARGIPNKNECRLLDNLLQNHFPELSDFPYLFLYEWTPSTMVGQGDAVFADGNGGLVVVEAKAKSGGNRHVREQSEFYAQRLQEEYPEATVAAAILTNDGFAWVKSPTTTRTDRRDIAAPEAGESLSSRSTVAPETALALFQEDDEPSIASRLLAPSRLDQLEAMVVDREMKPLLRFYGLKVTGRKADLAERIYQHEKEAGIAGGF